MKANELMIGDWVNYSNNPKKIKGAIDFTIAKDFEPIPLTEEILRANGFRWTGGGDSTMMLISPYDEVNERYNIYVGLVKKTIEVFVAVPEYRIRDVRKTNKVSLECCGCYVHKLQHALRLCGLYELADNFKV